eukprot:CAMPEP_0177577308 /NCGR_PEP_ID=MMETSP0369-20130122/80571_1 /TAXON_ID=447022 ORGANISM="Scrippsiella hangoei-like, Strain SHHI-4" /NCGR_SAMPLE_ID=MMETSP0369 /ASSEMBLY_ACC=CAM_ASM_000364 /LENGTH=262 /DNA_ID=CAMNT_0019065637 /DNA_START=39 /DNA_END=827 /DNA_ORIENTATION=-
MCAKDEVGLNLLTGRLFREFADVVEHVAVDDSVRVFVLRSSDEDFWMAHFDLHAIMKLPPSAITYPGDRELTPNTWHILCDRLRNMPKATIAEVVGRCGGGGNEFCMNFDMRFGVRGSTCFCQMEVPLGLSPGGTGCITLPGLIGPGRAFEMVLGGIDVDADTAERWGLLNRCFPDTASCRDHVDEFAARIASFPPHAVRAAKASLLAVERMPRREACLETLHLFNQTLAYPDARKRMEAFLGRGGQTRPGERDLQGTLSKL